MSRFLRVAAAAAGALFLSGAALAQGGYEPTAADREGIARTLATYARALDLADPDLYVSVFTEDGAVYDGDSPMAVGHAELAAIVQGVADGRTETAAAGEPVRQTYHLDANPWIEFLGPDHAIQHAYYVALTQTGQGPGAALGLLAAGSATNELRRIDGEWLIVKRTILVGP